MPNSKNPDLDLQVENIRSSGGTSNEEDSVSYQKRMQKRKEVQDKRLQQRQKEKGLIIVFTGHGKGKTTASLGMALRMLGHGERVAIIQFIKGGWSPGEAEALKAFGNSLSWHALGEGFTWETQDRDRDQKLVSNAWKIALQYINKNSHKLIILDEINIAINHGYLKTKEVLHGLSNKPESTHVVLTGRRAHKEIIDYADLITEMKLVKHPFKEQGIKAQKGIEF